jgi:O-antigen/teichoic acid export membrane protein
MPKEYGNSILWGNILNTALNFILIPFAGPIGAALATLGAKITVTIVGYYYFRRATNYPILKDYLLFFIASVIPLLSVIILSAVLNEKILLTLIFILIYSLLVWSIYNKYFKLRMIKTS